MSTSAALIALLLWTAAADVTLRGRIAPHQEHGMVFTAEGGEEYPLFRSLTSEALFTDPRLRERQLEVSGRMHSVKTGFLEVINLYSIKDGVRHEVFYWCETCHIRATAPGDCWCCFAPFEFREVPVQ
jgi:hypothetical protein